MKSIILFLALLVVLAIALFAFCKRLHFKGWRFDVYNLVLMLCIMGCGIGEIKIIVDWVRWLMKLFI